MEYAIKNYDEKNMAKARLNDAAVSTKVAIEICNMIRSRKLYTAKRILEEVSEKKRAVPYKRFNKDVGHKVSIGPGRYPMKASKAILSLLKLAEANAQHKGLGQSLIIHHLVANKGADQWHQGRQRRRKMKRSHIEVVLKEVETEVKKQMKKEEKRSEERRVGKECRSRWSP